MDITKETLEANGITIELTHRRFGVYDFTIYQMGEEVKPYLAVGNGYRKVCVYVYIDGVGKQLGYFRTINTLVGFDNPEK